MKLWKSLSVELDQTNASLGFDATEFRARAALFEQHVADFAVQLRAPVRRALKREGRTLIAGQWIADAVRVVRQHFAPLALDDGDRSAEIRAVQSDLALQLRLAVLSVPNVEVEEHATQLAQLLLSNWFGLLEHAMQDHETDVIDLNVDGLPKTARLDAVLHGVAAYAISPSAAVAALRRYQRTLAVGSKTALSPTLHLIRAEQGWQVARTRPNYLPGLGS